MVLFSSEKIKEALNSHEASLDSHRSELSVIKASLQDRVDHGTLNAQLKQVVTTSAQKLDAAILELEQQVSALRERTVALEERERGFREALAAKAETSLLQSREQHLAGCIGALEAQHQDLKSSLASKAEVLRVDEHQKQLGALPEQLSSMQQNLRLMDAKVSTKADAAHLEEQRGRANDLVSAITRQGDELRSALGAKASTRQHAELSGSVAGMRSQLAELEQELRAKLGEIDATLAKTVDMALFEQKAKRLEEALEQLALLEQRQAVNTQKIHEALSSKADKEASSQQHLQHQQTLSACASKQDTAEQIHSLQDQLDACRAQAVRYNEALTAALATKVECEHFERQWDQVVMKEIRPDIRWQREQLNAALEKKDQLIMLAERMQADLGCALALRGRGPPRLGPLVPPASPRKFRTVRQSTVSTPEP